MSDIVTLYRLLKIYQTNRSLLSYYTENISFKILLNSVWNKWVKPAISCTRWWSTWLSWENVHNSLINNAYTGELYFHFLVRTSSNILLTITVSCNNLSCNSEWNRTRNVKRHAMFLCVSEVKGFASIENLWSVTKVVNQKCKDISCYARSKHDTIFYIIIPCCVFTSAEQTWLYSHPLI